MRRPECGAQDHAPGMVLSSARSPRGPRVASLRNKEEEPPPVPPSSKGWMGVSRILQQVLEGEAALFLPALLDQDFDEAGVGEGRGVA
jgi:hypothetical protein